MQHGKDHGEDAASGAMVNMTEVFRECTEEMVDSTSDEMCSPPLHQRAQVLQSSPPRKGSRVEVRRAEEGSAR